MEKGRKPFKMSKDLSKLVKKLASDNPELRKHLVPLLKEAVVPIKQMAKKASIKTVEQFGLFKVYGPYTDIAPLIKSLKQWGFRYEPVHKVWEMPLEKVTPALRKRLDKLIAKQTPWEDILQQAVTNGWVLSFVYNEELIQDARKLKGTWDKKHKYWVFPTARAYKEMSDIVKDKEDILNEILKKKEGYLQQKKEALRKGWFVQFDYDTDLIKEAKSLNGLWDTNQKVWVFLDISDYKKMKRAIHEDDDKDVPSNAIVRSQSSKNKTPRFQKGDSFRDPENHKVLTVFNIMSKYYAEDGRSFGLGMDRGWAHSFYCKLAGKKGVAEVELQEFKELSRQQMVKAYQNMVKMFKKKGKFPKPGSKLITLRGKKHMESDTSSILYGGGHWFVVESGKIWYVENNGADGDNWAHNNIATSGAGALGWYLPYSEGLAEELKIMDKKL